MRLEEARGIVEALGQPEGLLRQLLGNLTLRPY